VTAVYHYACVVHLEKIAFSCRMALTCNAAWVDCPAYLELMNMQRQFTVKLNPTGLGVGVHFAEVRLASCCNCTITMITELVIIIWLFFDRVYSCPIDSIILTVLGLALFLCFVFL